MREKITRAIEELGKYYPEFTDLQLKDIQLGKETRLVDDVLITDSVSHALLYLAHHISGVEVSIDSHFKTFGTMIDLSRNAVFTVNYMKEVIRKKALMGINRIMLYLEDIYEVPEEPYFGYMRGRYLKEEIHAIVDYAEIFDMEIIPCIQTLGHFGQFLRWEHNSHLKDQQTVIMTNTKESYVFIERLIKRLREMFKTNKIHVGLDETFGLGFGKYYKMFGYEPQYDVFIRHLNKVNEICLKYGFDEVMMWSDMFFRISNSNEYYYDPNVTFHPNIINDIPSNVALVYWDYYNWNKEIVDGMILKHKDLEHKVIMASGTWIWTKLAYDKTKTDQTAKVHIQSCCEHDVDEIYFTQWNDDGAPCNYDTVFLGVFEMACEGLLKERSISPTVFKFVTKMPYDVALLLSRLNDSPIDPLPILWDDPLMGIYLNNEVARDETILDQTIAFFNDYLESFPEKKDFNVEHIERVAKLLKQKVMIRQLLVKKYKNNESLTDLIPLLENAVQLTEDVLKSFREMWLSRYKAFGLDVIQSRLATLAYRFKETIERIHEYEQKTIPSIDELDEKVGPHQPFRMNHMNVAYSTIHVLSY